MNSNDSTKSPVHQPMWKLRASIWASRMRTQWKLFAEVRIGLVGISVIALFGGMAVLHPLLMKFVWDPNIYDPVTGFDFDIFVHPSPPSSGHWLGTDPIGRDILSQLMKGTQGAFVLGGVAALVTIVVATTVGSVSAYFGRWVDAILMRAADLVIMTPTVSFLVVLGALWDLSFWMLALIIGLISGFGATAVVVKSQALTITVKPYIEAARGSGGSHFHVLRTHVIPNLMPLAFLYMMFTVTAAIFSEAVLSYFGIMNIRMSWGIMIHTAQTGGYLLSGFQYWWLLFPPGLSITLLAGSFYLVGRALDQVINPRLRRR